jgi:hypothetical protein
MGCRLAVNAAASILSLVVIGLTSVAGVRHEAQRLGAVLADLPRDLTTELILVDISSGQKAYASLNMSPSSLTVLFQYSLRRRS